MEVIDFISVSVAIMGLIAFFGLCKAELKDHNALHKVGNGNQLAVLPACLTISFWQ